MKANPQYVRSAACAIVASLAPLSLVGCPSVPPGDGFDRFVNSTDKTNAGAGHTGAAACTACHTDIAALHAIHPHAHALTPLEGRPPRFPVGATNARILDPPGGTEWTDYSYLLGGYEKPARFIDQNGFALIGGERLPFDFDRFAFVTTGPQRQSGEAPQFQDSRPGIAGTWSQPGVQCEACHGPGSNHFFAVNDAPSFDRSRIFVDASGDQTCRACHSRPFESASREIAAEAGFIRDQSQWQELQASRGHATFACTVCHDPHRSLTQDRGNAIRNECTACHTTENMARHAGAVYTGPDGVRETLACQSCHMPFAVTTGPPTIIDSVNISGRKIGEGRIGDTRSHIFRLSTAETGLASMFTADGSAVRRDSAGHAAITLEFVCLRCHNGQGSVFGLSLERAAEIAPNLHPSLE